MNDDVLAEFQRKAAEVQAVLDEYVRAVLSKTESPATVEIAMRLFHDGWDDTIANLLRAARLLAGDS